MMTMKRIGSFLLAVLMVLSMINLTVFAEDARPNVDIVTVKTGYDEGTTTSSKELIVSVYDEQGFVGNQNSRYYYTGLTVPNNQKHPGNTTVGVAQDSDYLIDRIEIEYIKDSEKEKVVQYENDYSHDFSGLSFNKGMVQNYWKQIKIHVYLVKKQTGFANDYINISITDKSGNANTNGYQESISTSGSYGKLVKIKIYTPDTSGYKLADTILQYYNSSNIGYVTFSDKDNGNYKLSSTNHILKAYYGGRGSETAWHKDENLGSYTQYNNRTEEVKFTGSNKKIVLKVYCDPIPDVQYTVNYHFEKLAGGYETIPVTYTAKKNAIVKAENYSDIPEGYTPLSDGALEGGKNDGKLVLNVYYPLNQYTVTFNAGDHGLLTQSEGSTGQTEIIVSGIKHGTHFRDAVPTDPIPIAYSGYEFNGWDSSFPETITESKLYTAKWEVVSSNVTVYHNYGNRAPVADPNYGAKYDYNTPVTVEPETEPGFTLNPSETTVITVKDDTTNEIPYTLGDGGKVTFNMPENQVVVNFFYEPEDTEYRVEYYYDGELDPDLTKTFTEVEGQRFKVDQEITAVDTSSDEVTKGYGSPVGVVGLPLTLSHDKDQNVIRVYFASEPDQEQMPETNIKVIHEYYLNNVKQAPHDPDYISLNDGETSISIPQLFKPQNAKDNRTYTPRSVTVNITTLQVPYEIQHILENGTEEFVAATQTGKAAVGSTLTLTEKLFNGFRPYENNPKTLSIVRNVDSNKAELRYYYTGTLDVPTMALGAELTPAMLRQFEKEKDTLKAETPAGFDGDNPTNPDSPDGDNPTNPDSPDGDNPTNPDSPDGDNPTNPDSPDGDNPTNPDAPNGGDPTNPEGPTTPEPEGEGDDGQEPTTSVEIKDVATASGGDYDLNDTIEYSEDNFYEITISYYLETRSVDDDDDDDDDEPFSLGWDGTVVHLSDLGQLPKTGSSKKIAGVGAILLLSGAVLKTLRFRRKSQNNGESQSDDQE